jgi:hypothetical protein
MTYAVDDMEDLAKRLKALTSDGDPSLEPVKTVTENAHVPSVPIADDVSDIAKRLREMKSVVVTPQPIPGASLTKKSDPYQYCGLSA